MLSISDVIVSQKGSNGEGELHFFGQDYFRKCLQDKKEPSVSQKVLST